jgi:dipeptidase
MCDTLWALGPQGSIFAKNSDRPPTEVQLVAAHDRRPGAPTLGTQYLTIPDLGAAATVLARPTWLWGAEHGLNEHGVAIGNEEIYTVVDAAAAPPALIGMDLVRLGLERARTADEALEVVTGLLARFGQGGVANTYGEAYFSSFLIADPVRAWVLETAGSAWAAKPVGRAGAISNRITIGTDWSVASDDLVPGDDFDRWRRPGEPTGHADRRLAASRALLAARPGPPGPRQTVAHLRDHGRGPWGAPGAGDAPQGPPAAVLADFTGVTVCMHVRGFMATTSSMVAELPADPSAPRRAWVATGSPCVSVFVPVLFGPGPQAAVPDALGDEQLWHDVATLRTRVEGDPEAMAAIRGVLDPIEAELWEEADALSGEPGRWTAAAGSWGSRVAAAAAGLVGRPGVA